MTTTGKKPVRVLHIVGGMVHGGIETWLMHVLRHTDRAQFQMDFLVHTTTPCPYDDEVRALGGRIIPCTDPARLWSYARNFRRILRECGPYDIVHSHVHHFSGVTLRLAHAAGVPVRIAHSHVGVMPEDTAPGLLRRGYLKLMHRWISRYATVGFAASRQAAAALFGADWESDTRWKVLYYGIDLAPFHAGADRSVRAEVGLPDDAFVVGHVGRFEEQKNHRFLLEIARGIVNLEPRTFLLLIGAGSLRPEIERRVTELGLASHVIFAGLRADVPRVLCSAVGCLVMPSLCEGLGLAVVEAQAAGVPSVLADTIPPEADVVPSLVTRVRLSDPPAVWAKAVLATRDRPQPVAPNQALALVEASPFNIRQGVGELERRYLAVVNART